MKTVLIVESPAKARKIQGYFDDGTICIASFGHIRDLDPTNLSVDVENNFEPTYVTSPGKWAQKSIKAIRDHSKNYRILLAADDADAVNVLTAAAEAAAAASAPK